MEALTHSTLTKQCTKTTEKRLWLSEFDQNLIQCLTIKNTNSEEAEAAAIALGFADEERQQKSLQIITYYKQACYNFVKRIIPRVAANILNQIKGTSASPATLPGNH